MISHGIFIASAVTGVLAAVFALLGHAAHGCFYIVSTIGMLFATGVLLVIAIIVWLCGN